MYKKTLIPSGIKPAFFFLFYLLIHPAQAQITIDPRNVFHVDSSLSPSPELTNKLAAYHFILMGEMHGTREPVTFVKEVAKAISKTKKVKIGFEIPADEIHLKSKPVAVSDLVKEKFFAGDNGNRSSEAWAEAISELSGSKNCELFFYDYRKPQEKWNRDSIMFVNISEEYKKDTAVVIITISGNIHNQVQTYKGKNKMGWYVRHYLSTSVLSIDHVYESGTMYNSTDQTAGLRKVNSDKSNLKSISKTPDFFLLDLNHDFSKNWDAFLFTTKINASFPAKNK
jgi:hypothetical protein